jgi:hypothetical protein
MQELMSLRLVFVSDYAAKPFRTSLKSGSHHRSVTIMSGDLASRVIASCGDWIAGVGTGDGAHNCISENQAILAGAMDRLKPVYHLMDSSRVEQDLAAQPADL